MRGPLRDQRLVLSCSDQTHAAWRVTWRQRSGLPLLACVSFERGASHPKDAGRLDLAHPPGQGTHDLLP